MKKNVKLCIGIVGGGLALIVLAVLVFPKHQSTPYLRAFAEDEFSLEGELVLWGSKETTRNHVLEYHSGTDYGIEYPARSYFFIDGQYYLEDAEHGLTPVSVPVEEMDQIVEMFDRASVLSNYDFSGAKYLSGSSIEIPESSTGELLLCDCEEYQLADQQHTVRMYFHSGSLYAIQAKEDSHFLFYVSSFSRQPQAFT